MHNLAHRDITLNLLPLGVATLACTMFNYLVCNMVDATGLEPVTPCV